MEAHFVTFYSPGTFMAEITQRPIELWDVDVAVEMTRSIEERHRSTPYGFQFSTRSRGVDELDSKVCRTSPMYYLGGRVDTLEDLEARNDPREAILRDNMRINKYKRTITNNNSWSWTQPLNDDDVVLDFKP